MNKERREKLSRATTYIENAKALIEEVRDEEQESFDNMPESMQSSEKGEKAETAIQEMEEALDKLGELVEGCDEAQGHVETAAE